jgi:hypothetical protein
MTPSGVDIESLQAQGRLELRVQRAVWRHKLVTLGNACLVAWVFSVLMLALWYGAYTLLAGTDYAQLWWYDMLRVTSDQFAWLNARLLLVWKLAATFVFLLPGLALRLCAGPAD